MSVFPFFSATFQFFDNFCRFAEALAGLWWARGQWQFVAPAGGPHAAATAKFKKEEGERPSVRDDANALSDAAER